MKATRSVRARLWAILGLSPFDGLSFRETGPDGDDTIVLILNHELSEKVKHVTEFEGFKVVIRPSLISYAF